jgi:hypothetical protein
MTSTIIGFLITPQIFAEQYLEVKPVLLENGFDVCSRLVNSLPSESNPNFTYLSNHTAITMIDYNGTKMVTTLTPGIMPNMGLVYDHGNGMPPQIYKSNSSLLQMPYVDKINLQYDRYNESGFTMAMVNTGNKDVTISYPFASILGMVLNSENGTSVYLDHHGIYSDNPFADDKLWSLTWPNIGSVALKPGQSVVQYYVLSRPSDVPSEYYHYPPPGNYTISSVVRLLGDIDGKCTMVNLWSKPINLTIFPSDKIQEFPFAVPILLVSIASLMIIYRLKFEIK